MCGIAGIYLQDKSKIVDNTILKDMCSVLGHRGPDDAGYFLDQNIGLAMRRLSIIDLPTGHQPIHNEDKTLQVIFNGEIYNYLELRAELIKKGHVFYTNSDTEVIAHLYEEKQEDCLQDLSGMFAFAVLDLSNRKLLIARDRLGIKPLYYYYKSGIFAFASEVKAILRLPCFQKELDFASLYNFLSLNYVPGPLTMFKDIKQLLPGYYSITQDDTFKIKQYWDLDSENYSGLNEEAVMERLGHLLRNSVNMMLKSDVPLGAFLSGGLDSSCLVSIIQEFRQTTLKTFSVGFNEKSYDESYFSRLISKRFHTQHYGIICKPADLIEWLPKIVWHADNLLADPSMVPTYLLSKLAREQVKVCISGDGGDELFMGYPTYQADAFLKFYQRIPGFIRRGIIKNLANFLPASVNKLSFEYKAKKFIEGSEFDLLKAHYWWRTIFNDRDKELLLSPNILNALDSRDSYVNYLHYYNNYPGKDNDLRGKFLYADLKLWLADNNLSRVDGMSMANSLEVRVPFLDHQLVEFLMSVSPSLKMKNFTLKYLLKRAMKSKLPREIIFRKKSGWHIPLAQWFRKELKDYTVATITGAAITKSGFFNKQAVELLLNDHFKGRKNNTFKIWGLLVFAHWHNTFA